MIRLRKINKDEKQTANLQMVKETNLTYIFNLIYKYEPVSRAELAQRTKLSPTTVSSLVEELQQNDIIVETGAGATTTSGRKPIMLEINPGGGYVISAEMVEDGFRCFLYDLRCREIDGSMVKLADYGSIGNRIVQAADELLQRYNIPEDKLFGICIGVPGLVDYENNRIISSTVIPLNEGIDFYSDIKGRFNDIPVVLENESSLYAYAEMKYGSAGDVRNLVFIDINVGIGSGIILDGNLYRGGFGLAGELGHVSIDMKGPKCKCGNRGCLEIMASIPTMAQKIIFAIMSSRETILKETIKGDFNKVDVEIIRHALDKKDGLVQEVVDETAAALAFGINNIINMFNPEVIVIGGEIVKLGGVFLERVKKTLSSIELKPNVQRVVVKYSNLQGNIATLGGARLILDNILKIQGLAVGDL